MPSQWLLPLADDATLSTVPVSLPLLSFHVVCSVCRNPLELWKQAYCGFFPQVQCAMCSHTILRLSSRPLQVAVREEGGDPCNDTNYLEPDIDSVRALKDEVIMM